MEHTKEPWRYTPAETEDDGSRIYAVTGANITGADSESIFRIDLGEVSGLDDANARRIVACVNACEGIQTEFLELGESEFVKALSERNKIKQQRDHLLAALERIAAGQEMSVSFTPIDVMYRYQEIARAAIASVENKETKGE